MKSPDLLNFDLDISKSTMFVYYMSKRQEYTFHGNLYLSFLKDYENLSQINMFNVFRDTTEPSWGLVFSALLLLFIFDLDF
jgi:hypothetical protein